MIEVRRVFEGAFPGHEALVADRNNWCFACEGGAWLFLRLCPGLYEGHAEVLPEYRGEWTRRAGQACLWRLFVESDALEIVLRPAANNLAAIAGCRMLGAQLEFVTPEPTTLGVPQHVYVLTLTRWLGVISGGREDAYLRFADACPHKGTAAFRRYWSLSGRSEPCPLPPLPPQSSPV